MKYTRASASDAVNERERRNLALAYEAACESIVLLKNEGVLPFSGPRIAAFGPGVAYTVKGGSGSGEVNERHSVSIREGLELRQKELVSQRWLQDYESAYARAQEAQGKRRSLRPDLRHPAEMVNALFGAFRLPEGRPVQPEDLETDTQECIYVLSRQAGEGKDRTLTAGDYLLTGQEIADIRLLSEHYPRFVLVINAGACIDLTPLDAMPGVRGILFVGQPGTRGGLAVVDVLYGAVCPSAALADTWPMQYEDIPYAGTFSSLGGNRDEELYREGIYVGYRYFDAFAQKPRFPFGFGLSYTAFETGMAEVCVDGTSVAVTVPVTNIGSTAGKKIVQLYVSAPVGRVVPENKRLAAFAKTSLLSPGATERLELRFDLSAMSSYCTEESAQMLNAGDYILLLGSSSADVQPIIRLRLGKEVILSRHKAICPMHCPDFDLSPASSREGNAPDVPVILLDAAAFPYAVYTYPVPEIRPDADVRALVDSLSEKQMIDLVVGDGMQVSDPIFHLPGAVGTTTSSLWEKGLVNITLCDGPAGLRIQKRSVRTKDNRIKALELPLAALEMLPSVVKNQLKGNEASGTLLYQFTTAFPAASALAQSWDCALMQRIGAAVQEEMKEYGCTCWLAPAINIHRNPLCGRNFEYFSEDPFLTGTMAAAMVRGVQQEPGYYAVIKHFACNNREDNRNHVSSVVSERALREIYLRAFELCVREGGAACVMTAYNRINGVPACNSYDLCTDVLRNEWGFDGVVMTDWFAPLVFPNGSARCLEAGNDLIMPGEPVSRAQLLLARKTGTLSRAALKRCCCNVVRLILDSALQKETVSQSSQP